MRPPSLTAVQCANPPLPGPCSLLPARHLSLYHGPAPGVGPLRALPALITLRRRFPRAHTASSRREERPAHGQETFGTPTPVHPHRIRTSPRRIVLPHPPDRKSVV